MSLCSWYPPYPNPIPRLALVRDGPTKLRPCGVREAPSFSASTSATRVGDTVFEHNISIYQYIHNIYIYILIYIYIYLIYINLNLTDLNNHQPQPIFEVWEFFMKVFGKRYEGILDLRFGSWKFWAPKISRSQHGDELVKVWKLGFHFHFWPQLNCFTVTFVKDLGFKIVFLLKQMNQGLLPQCCRVLWRLAGGFPSLKKKWRETLENPLKI